MKQACKTPCPRCPFSRAVKPGETGGSAPEVFVGQAHGPFWLPCHMDYKPGVHPKDQSHEEVRQCAGAAIYRANTGAAELMPDGLAKGERNTDLVFASPAELIAHHRQMSVYMVQAVMREVMPVSLLVRQELAKQEVKVLAAGRRVA